MRIRGFLERIRSSFGTRIFGGVKWLQCRSQEHRKEGDERDERSINTLEIGER